MQSLKKMLQSKRSCQIIRIWIILLAVLCYANIVNAQICVPGTPFIQNFHRSEYQGGNQTWDIQQASNGMMYFANNDGLLEFDGMHWNKYSLPNNSIARSIRCSNDGIIYAGGFNEIGYYTIGNNGGAIYQSLMHLIPEGSSDFDEVWKIYIHPDGIIYQTYNQLLIYKDEKIQVIDAPSIFHFSFLVKGEYYVNDMENGLMRYSMGELFKLTGVEKLIGKEIWGILPYKNKLLIATASEGVYYYNGNSSELLECSSNDFLKRNQIYSTILFEDKLAFGTIHDGILICDFEGNPVHHLNKTDGLQNNTVLCISNDSYGNIWLGTDQGIDYIKINSPLTKISDNYGLSSGYAAFIDKDRIYLGTNQGLFTKRNNSFDSSRGSSKQMSLVKNTSGQVWSLCDVDGTLFCGHNNGAYIITNTEAKKISEVPGAWMFLKVPGYPNKLISGTYSGLALYSKRKDEWQFVKVLSGYSESSRNMEFDPNGSLWITHGYKGIYNIKFSTEYDSIIDIRFYNDKNSSLPERVTSLVNIRGKILFPGSNGILEYSAEDDDFVKNIKFRTIDVVLSIDH